ncbi:hypothetical protein LCGC14_1030640 [marine sediment metagenome]|uniref:Uncharacterized protein n=1 Tax=marine sediment metagenome TaxID=412755 RepID=A0A0F9MUP9_9ZZZZ
MKKAKKKAKAKRTTPLRRDRYVGGVGKKN